MRWMAVVVCAVVMAATTGVCQQPAAQEQQAARVPDVPYEPTPNHVVTEMLQLAQVRSGDVVYDLGCGDGRIVIAAVKQFGARGVCVDIDPQRILESRANAEEAGVTQRMQFLTQDLFDTDIRDATVVTLFLYPDVNLKLRPKLWRDLKPGTRVVSYVHDMGDWTPQEVRTVEGTRGPRKVYLWIVPADGKERAGGGR
jgi:ribosomal protein L11 methylase PrmA